MAGITLRKCEIMQQLKYMPGYPNWADTLLDNLQNDNEYVKNWAFIVHDKDCDDDGNIIEPHLHLVLDLKTSLQLSTIGNIVGVEKQYVSSIKQKKRAGGRYYADIGGALSYLTHRNAKDKHQYDDSEVIAMPGFDWVAERTKSENLRLEVKNLEKTLAAIEVGEIKRYNLAEHITQTMFIKYKKEFDRAFEFYDSILKNKVDRNVDVVYIFGESGAGKTTLAKDICTQKGLSYSISGSSRDPLQEYAGQSALILDDLRPEFFSTSDLLKLLDNNTASAAGARYKDKWIEAELIIITSVLTLDTFFMNLKDNLCEPSEQLKRRIKIMIDCKQDTYDMYTYINDKKDYVYVSTHENTVTKKYKNLSDFTQEELEEFGNLLGAKIPNKAKAERKNIC